MAWGLAPGVPLTLYEGRDEIRVAPDVRNRDRAVPILGFEN
jgi:hypothetical protein